MVNDNIFRFQQKKSTKKRLHFFIDEMCREVYSNNVIN